MKYVPTKAINAARDSVAQGKITPEFAAWLRRELHEKYANIYLDRAIAELLKERKNKTGRPKAPVGGTELQRRKARAGAWVQFLVSQKLGLRESAIKQAAGMFRLDEESVRAAYEGRAGKRVRTIKQQILADATPAES